MLLALNSIKSYYDDFFDEISTTIALIIGAFIVYKVIVLIFKKIAKKSKHNKIVFAVLRQILRITLFISVFLLVIQTWGVNITPLVASVSVFGLAFSFGAKQFVEDAISGFFVIVEEQYDLGDVIEVDGFKGSVVWQGIRTTKIQNWKGEIMIISNRALNKIINYSTTHATAIVDFPIGYQVEYHEVEKLIQDYFATIKGDEYLEVPSINGINDFDEYKYLVKIMVKVKPGTQFQVERDIKTGIKKILENKGIIMPKSRLSR